MYKSRVLIAWAIFLPMMLHAKEVVPLIGKQRADSHMLCGNNIDVEIHQTDDNSLIIGLANKKTKSMDFFVSGESVASDMHYTRYYPVNFDELSGQFVRKDSDAINIVWGSSAVNDEAKNTFKLALGAHIYDCGVVEVWPDDTANDLYGDDD
ncbi:hypothetical protein [Enterobacter asburiae]|jgi:hypothetical protein|uniref:hypothetical protein n=1 Tax=Enterobacter asburiae TaxID=61645 RepID=UPI002C1E11B9|nr:hypothetical protein [Enterobacter asburiae]